MTKYMLSVYPAAAGRGEPMSEEDTRRGWEQIAQLEADMTAAGVFYLSARLDEPANAKVARPTRRRVNFTDGPFPETKEQLGGFYLINAEDLDAALAWASRVAGAISEPIEVRALAGIADGPTTM